MEDALRRAITVTDAGFLQRARRQGLNDGTTAVFALLCSRRLLIGSIGDSYAVLCGRNASAGAADGGAAELQVRAEVLSALHSPARQDEKRRIQAAGGWVKTTAGPREQLHLGLTAQVWLICDASPMSPELCCIAYQSQAVAAERWAAAAAGGAHAVPRHWRPALPWGRPHCRPRVHTLADNLPRCQPSCEHSTR